MNTAAKTQPSDTERKIAQTAKENGWTCAGSGRDLRFYRGKERVYVCYSKRGTVTKASTQASWITGRDKAWQVIEQLRSLPLATWNA